MLWYSALLGAQLALAVSTGKVLSRRWEDTAQKHSWNEIPRGWQLLAPAPPGYPLNLKIGLKQHGIEQLVENLLEISDPTHTRYAFLSGSWSTKAI